MPRLRICDSPNVHAWLDHESVLLSNCPMMLEIVQEVTLRTALAKDRIKTKTSFERTKERLRSEIIYAKNV